MFYAQSTGTVISGQGSGQVSKYLGVLRPVSRTVILLRGSGQVSKQLGVLRTVNDYGYIIAGQWTGKQTTWSFTPSQSVRLYHCGAVDLSLIHI